jgi:hypothetical protein
MYRRLGLPVLADPAPKSGQILDLLHLYNFCSAMSMQLVSLKKTFRIASETCRKVWLSISARLGNRCDDRGCIHRSLSRISLFFCLRDRPGSAGDRTLYRQQTLGTSCLLPWSYPHRVSCQLSDFIVAPETQSVNEVGKKSCSREAEREPAFTLTRTAMTYGASLVRY